VATLTIDGDTVAIDCGGTWSYGRRLDAWRTTLTIEAYDRAETPNGSLDTVVLFYDVPNRPPRVSFELEGSSLTMRWQPCTDLDFARFAVWTSAAARIDTTIPPDAVYPSGTDTAHVFALDPAADRLFGCAIVDSAGNYVMGDNSAGHMRGGLLFRHTMVRVPAGHFRVGDSVLVHLTNAFYMDTVEIPQDSYERIIGYNPARFTGLHRPVESVSWFDAVRFCNQRSKYHGFDTVYTYERLRGDGAVNLQCRWERNGYRLPTADEWEYAARAGVRTVYLWGDSASDSLAGEYRWFSATCDSNVWLEPHAPAHGSQPVGRLRPNAWSLYDMGGNVLEWVWDYAGTAGKVNGRIDYRGPSVPVCCGEERDGPQRAAKGTTWLSSGDMPAFDALNYIPERQRSYIVGIRTVQTIPRLE
jgi:formylglycine-generating enzyme required for sulfatase activity